MEGNKVLNPKLERTDSSSSLSSNGKVKHSGLERTDSCSSFVGKRKPTVKLERTESVSSLANESKPKPGKLSFALIAKQALEKKKVSERYISFISYVFLVCKI